MEAVQREEVSVAPEVEAPLLTVAEEVVATAPAVVTDALVRGGWGPGGGEWHDGECGGGCV